MKNSNVDELVKTMAPMLHPEVFVFTSFASGDNFSALDPVMLFKEREGTTLVITQAVAKREGIAYEFPCRMITLNVHSALDAVGFLARITNQLAKFDLSVNPVAGFYHDHLFIPVNRAEEAMQALHELTNPDTPSGDSPN